MDTKLVATTLLVLSFQNAKLICPVLVPGVSGYNHEGAGADSNQTNAPSRLAEVIIKPDLSLILTVWKIKGEIAY